MAFAVKSGRRFYLQFACMYIALDNTAAFELQQLLYFNCSGYLAKNIGLLAIDITFYGTVCPNDYFGSAVDIAYQGTINA